MGIHPYPIDDTVPPAVGQHSQPIILKVSETISPPRDHLHLVVKAFGDAVAFAETPHGDDGPAQADQKEQDDLWDSEQLL